MGRHAVPTEDLIKTKELYDSNNYNLAETSRQLNMSTEAIRYRLSRYKVEVGDYKTKSQIIEENNLKHWKKRVKYVKIIIKKKYTSSLDFCSKELKIEDSTLINQFFNATKINKKIFRRVKLNKVKKGIIDDFKGLKKKLGKTPSTSILQKKEGLGLYQKIRYYWKEYNLFLEEIEK